MIAIKVDGKTLFRGEVGEWINRTPDAFKDAIKPGTKPADYMKAILVILAGAVVTNTALRINVVTKGKNFTMTVAYP